MKKMTDDQIKLIAICEQSITKMMILSQKASQHNLHLIASELIAMGRNLAQIIDYQSRVFRDDTLVNHEPLFPEGQFPYGKKSNSNPG